MKVIVTFSGGKDSLAALLWVREHITTNFTTVFCDTGWEHPLTYEYIHRIADQLHLDLVTLKSKKYDGMEDLARKKKRWSSTKARFCTEELKSKPMIDYVLDEVRDNVMIVQGIRAAESPSRAAMSKQCTYFKYYFEPYGHDKSGKPKKHTYRGRDDQIARLEEQIGSSFFGPGKIPAHAIASGETYPTIRDVVRYVKWQNATGSLFEDDTATSCMSFYGLCE